MQKKQDGMNIGFVEFCGSSDLRTRCWNKSVEKYNGLDNSVEMMPLLIEFSDDGRDGD
jgi:hypothetical protein